MNDIYTILSIKNNDDNIQANIKLNPEHNIFKGHFPDNPVLPGVVQLKIVKEIINKVYNKKHTIKSASNIKFTGIITPETIFTIDIKVNKTDNGLSINAVIKNENKNFTKIKATLVKKTDTTF